MDILTSFTRYICCNRTWCVCVLLSISSPGENSITLYDMERMFFYDIFQFFLHWFKSDEWLSSNNNYWVESLEHYNKNFLSVIKYHFNLIKMHRKYTLWRNNETSMHSSSIPACWPFVLFFGGGGEVHPWAGCIHLGCIRGGCIHLGCIMDAPPRWTEWYMAVKTLPSPYFVCGW